MQTIIDIYMKDHPEVVLKDHESDYYAGAICPACGYRDLRKGDRFLIRKDGGRFWCRHCGIRGNIIEYLKLSRGLSVQDACRVIGYQKADTPFPARKKAVLAGRGATQAPTVPSERWQRFAVELLRQCQQHLRGKVCLAYLARRGIRIEVAEQCRLGWLTSDIFVKPESLGLTGGRTQCLPKGLMLPTFDTADRLVGVEIRCVPDHIYANAKIRYAAMVGSGSHNFRVGNCKDRIAVTEGTIDAILLHQYMQGAVSCIAVKGASKALDNESADLLRNAKHAYYIADNDEAGCRAYETFRSSYPQARLVLPLHGFKDLGEMVEAKVDLQYWIDLNFDERSYGGSLRLDAFAEAFCESVEAIEPTDFSNLEAQIQNFATAVGYQFDEIPLEAVASFIKSCLTWPIENRPQIEP
ncbi:MAG: toprim domain-containing protein [Desulfovibrionaceae bacterium]|nr:toprim domain-containing protein [Desulfovibrionaceae bacterium]